MPKSHCEYIFLGSPRPDLYSTWDFWQVYLGANMMIDPPLVTHTHTHAHTNIITINKITVVILVIIARASPTKVPR